MSKLAQRFAGVELGGTKVICVLAQGDTIIDRLRVPTEDPATTLAAANRQLLAWQLEAPLTGVGIASFGPVRLAPEAPDYGRILATPKTGWSGAEVVARLSAGIDAPCRIDTDVNAAALAEYRWGGGRGCESLIYLTIGTGLGGGLLIDGRPVHGRLHPEMGHLLTRRAPGDDFAGNCLFHRDCSEGLVSGPALWSRFGRDPAHVPADHPGWSHAAHDLAQLLAALIHLAAPHRVLIGGGVAVGTPHLLQYAIDELPRLLGGYYPDLADTARSGIIRPATLGDLAGPRGAIRLAQLAGAGTIDTW